MAEFLGKNKGCYVCTNVQRKKSRIFFPTFMNATVNLVDTLALKLNRKHALLYSSQIVK